MDKITNNFFHSQTKSITQLGTLVKHLLILISILLLSSPVISQETGVLYQYETSSGIQWNTFGNERNYLLFYPLVCYTNLSILNVKCQ